MSTPDDAFQVLLGRNEAGHGVSVGYPGYWLAVPKAEANPSDFDEADSSAEGLRLPPLGESLSVPSGNYIFGFWPGRRDIFIGAIRSATRAGGQPRRPDGSTPDRYENATWFFTKEGVFRGWLRGRRIADAADGRAMLFRLEGSNRVVTLRHDLQTTQARRFVWQDGGGTAKAYSLFDDLQLGLFGKGNTLVLASWRAD